MSVPLNNVNNQLQQEAGRIGEMISAKLIATDPWNRLVKQDTFPAGMGETIQTLVQERSTVPDAASTAWADVGTNTGTGNSCNRRNCCYCYWYCHYFLIIILIITTPNNTAKPPPIIKSNCFVSFLGALFSLP